MNTDTRRPAEPSTTGSAQQGWSVDPTRSKLEFSLRHIVVQKIRGQFDRWGGTLFVDRDQPALSTVEVWIDLASITTGDVERDAHVRSAEFLDVEHFPRARFSSGVVEVHGQTVAIDGRLELHGVVHDVKVEVKLGPVTTGADGRMRSRYDARAVIDRQSFGLHWNQDLDVGGVVVGDEVEIRATLEMIRLDENSARAASPVRG